MVKAYTKGYAAERSLVHTLAALGFMVIRAPRSGRIGLPSPDIVAIKNGRMLVIECKSRKDAFTVEQEQLAELKAWQDHGALALIAWKQSYKGWSFLHLADVSENNGNIGKKFTATKGFPLDKLEEIMN
ncbi:MAG: hypothetical protein HY513_06010 [Candidatus Aenigmarchaeota archaeon]|nr:hypothetical protein [Candidatus Aenigmarchaeota archaeon]